jgi:hypothetical protein
MTSPPGGLRVDPVEAKPMIDRKRENASSSPDIHDLSAPASAAPSDAQALVEEGTGR